MKKIRQNFKLQAIGLCVIMLSVMYAILSGIKFGLVNTGYVLGASDNTNSTQAVSSMIYDNGFMQIRSGYELVILFAFLILALYIIRQFVIILQKLGSDKNFGLGNILKIAVMDIIIFVLTVAGLASFNMWTIQRESPRVLTYERVTPETVRIVWKSNIPAMSQVLWGYSPEHLDNVSLGTSGEKKVQSHEVILTVLPEQDLYFKVIINGIKYGEAGISGYYRLSKNSKVDEIYELQLKEAGEVNIKSK